MSNVVLIDWDKNNRPCFAYLINTLNNKVVKVPIWVNNITVSEAIKSENLLKKVINNFEVVSIVDYRKYIRYFGLCTSNKLYDCCIDFKTDNIDYKINNILNNKKFVFDKWQEIRANAAEVYQKLEDRGVYHGHKIVHPIYEMDVYSGRSKTKKFNIQGMGSDCDIKHVNYKNNKFVRFDWISADMRIASYFSMDKDLLSSFHESDPYTHIEEVLGNKIDRNSCKLALNRSVNSLNYNHDIFKIFPKFRKWIIDRVSCLNGGQAVETILKRRFYSDGSYKNNKRAFNAILQGSVAHAMNNVISLIDEEFGDIILTEQHDSLTICVPDMFLVDFVKQVSKIMLYPFKGIIDDLKMPLKVEIGDLWGNYKYLKEYR